MDRYKIELLLKMRPPVTDDPYAHEVAAILTKPSIWHPIARRRFKKQFVNRVQLVLSEHNKSLIERLGVNRQEAPQQ